jgi:hypothetical protein
MTRHVTSEMPTSPCPYCGALVEQATSANRAGVTNPGSVGLCWECGKVCVYDERLQLRKPTAKELIEVQEWSQWPMIERMALGIRRRKR